MANVWVTPNRYRVRWYIKDGVEGRIKGEDVVETGDRVLNKEVASDMADRIIEDQEPRVFRKFFKAYDGCVAPENWRVTSVKEVPLSKYEILVRAVNEVMDQYTEPLTLRQIYYRLVARQVIPNTINEYKGLSRHLVKARETGAVDYRKIEDRLRTTIGGDSGFDSLEEYLEWRLDQLFNSHKYLDLAMWENQETFIEVWLEKDALSRTVSSVGNRFNIRTCPSRGYASFSYIAKAVERLKEVEHESIVIIYLGDHDPSGLDIPRDIYSRLVRYGVPGDKLQIDRIALTVEQIEEHRLPPAPGKTTDSRYQSFVDSTGSNDVVELDALEPPILQGILREAIEGYIDADLWNERVSEIADEKERLKEMLKDTDIDIPDFEYRFRWEDEEE